MSYTDRVRTCPHGIKHDPLIDSTSVCPDCKREQEARIQKQKLPTCLTCLQPTMQKLGIMHYCSNPQCPDYKVYKVI